MGSQAGTAPVGTFTTNQMRDANAALDDISARAGKLLLLISGYERGYRGHCCAKARTMAEKLRCSQRTVERCLKLLLDHGLIMPLKRRMRWVSRQLTELGTLAVAMMRKAPFHIMADHLADHKGNAEPTPKKIREPLMLNGHEVIFGAGSASPKVNPAEYNFKASGFMTKKTWDSLTKWMMLDGPQSYARCKIAHRTFRGLVVAIHKSREWGPYSRTIARRDNRLISADHLVMLAIQDAIRLKSRFGTVESAFAYMRSILLKCVEERRLPGEYRPIQK